MSDERRSEVLLGMKAKTTGMLQVLNMAKVRAQLKEGGTSSEDETQKVAEIEEDEDVYRLFSSLKNYFFDGMNVVSYAGHLKRYRFAPAI